MSTMNLAWLLATAADPKFRNPAKAVELAKELVRQAPQDGNRWNTLGAAHYRAGEWKPAIDALEKSNELLDGNELSYYAFFLAMAHWKLDRKEDARKWYDQAVQRMEKNKPDDEELRRFRAEAATLLGVTEKKD
jgi:eukaryotic-like serine/threonine-protein kinase